MKKIPTCYERVFEGHRITEVKPIYTSEACEFAVKYGDATLKLDGSCCMIQDHHIFKRYDFKPGRKLPDGAIPCQERPDEVTGHFPHWVKCDKSKPEDKWFILAFERYYYRHLWSSGETFEAIGKHFNGNPYKLSNDILVPHGTIELDVPRYFKGIKEFLEENYIEGVVFWNGNNPVCKIKRSDFGLPWGCKK